jgi:hypothetical protein
LCGSLPNWGALCALARLECSFRFLGVTRMRLAVAVAAFFGVVIYAPTARAEYLEHQCRHSSRIPGVDRRDFVLCEGGQGGPRYRFSSRRAPLSGIGATTHFALRISAPTAHCSPIKYVVRRVSPPGTDRLVGETKSGWYGFLQPGQSEDVDIGRDWGPGEHEVLIAALGVVEGCNTGQMNSFGVNVELVPIYQAPRPF